MGATATLETLRVDDLTILSSGAYKLLRVAGLGSPTPRQATFQRAERHGSSDHTAYYEGRVIDLGGLVIAPDDATLWAAWDALKGKLALGTDRIITFRRRGLSFDERAVVRVASPVDAEFVVGSPVIRWAVSLFAGDPRIYGAVLRSANYDPAAALAGGGMAVPMTFPLTFTVTTTSELQVANDGQFPSPPVLRVTGPVINPSVDNDTIGATLRLVYSLGSSDTIEIDVAARTLKLNGASRPDLLDASSSTWWNLAPGTNRLRLRGSGMALGSTLLTVEYRDARI